MRDIVNHFWKFWNFLLLTMIIMQPPSASGINLFTKICKLRYSLGVLYEDFNFTELELFCSLLSNHQ